MFRAFKRRAVWFLIGILFATGSYALVNHTYFKPEPTIPDDEAIKLAHDLNIELATQKKELKSRLLAIQDLEEDTRSRWVEEIRLRQVAEARFDQRPVKIIPGEILPPEIHVEVRDVPCPDSPDCTPSNATIGGECITEDFTIGNQKGVKILWKASASWWIGSQTYTIKDERTDPDWIVVETKKEPPFKIPRFRKTPWVGALWTKDDGLGLQASYAIQGPKWGVQPNLIVQRREKEAIRCISAEEGQCFQFGAFTEDDIVYSAGLSVTWRKKAWPPS